MNTLDLMWFIPSVISNIEIRAYMVICLLTLCLHLPHSYQYTSGLLNLFFFFFLNQSYNDYFMSFYKFHFALLRKTSILKIYVVQKHMSLMSPDKKALQLILMFALWGATYREGLKKEREGAIKYF